jgi:glutaryl-CoA dehydrogenase
MGRPSIGLNNLPYPGGDFFGFEQELVQTERDRLQEVRGWLDKEVRPIAVDCWTRGEFPMGIIPKLAELDIVSPVRRQAIPICWPA